MGCRIPGATPAPGGFGAFGAPATTPVGGLFSTTPAPLYGAPPAGNLGTGTNMFGTPAPSGGGLFGSNPPGTPGLFGSQPAPAPGGFLGMTAQAPFGGYSQQLQAPAMVAPPPVGTVMPPATNEIMASQLAALENKRRELEQTDNFRSKPTESAAITSVSLGERESSSLAGLTPMRPSYYGFGPSPRSGAKLRPRGFASPSGSTTSMLGPKGLSKLGSGGKPMAAADVVAASSATRLIISPSPKPRLRLTLGTPNNQQLPQQEETPLKLTNGGGATGGLGSIQAENTPGKRNEPASVPNGRPEASPKNGSTPRMPGSRSYAYYQQVIGSVDDESNALDEERTSHLKGVLAPKLSKAGYTCTPSVARLQTFEPVDLAAVPGFSVERPGVGKIVWEGAVDVRGADLDRIVVIEPKSVSVYTDEDEKGTKPPVGTKLNRPAILTLEGVFPPEGGGPESTQRFVRKVERQTKKMHAELINYEPTTGEWMLRVQHFSIYALNDDDDDDTETGEFDELQRVDQAVVQQKETRWDFQQGEREGRSPERHGVLKKKRKDTPHKPSRGMLLMDFDDEMVDLVEVSNYAEVSGESRVMEEAEAALNNMQLSLESELLAIVPVKKVATDLHSTFPEESAPFCSDRWSKSSRYIPDARDVQASSVMPNVSSRIARASSVGSSQNDFGLRMGRSFRVAWSPNGSFLRPKNGGAVLLQSYPKFSDSNPEVERRLLETQRPFCQKENVKKEGCPLFSVPTDTPSGNLLKCLESYSNTLSFSLDNRTSVARSAISLLQVLREIMSSKKANSDFGDFGGATQSNEQDLDGRIIHAIGRWLADSCSEDVRKEIQEGKRMHETYKTLLSAVSGCDLGLASSIADECGLSQLAIMIGSGIEAQKDILHEIDSWKRNGRTAKIPRELYRVYCLIAGDETMEESIYRQMQANYEFDWRRRMGMKLAYCSSQNFKDVPSLIHQYETKVTQGVAPFPTPLTSSGDSVPCVLFSLLKLSTQSSELTLANTMNPLGYTNCPHDYSLAFHLAALISAVGCSEPLSANDEYNLLDGFATQLLCRGFWWWSVYVVLHRLDHSQKVPNWKFKSAKSLVVRNYDGSNVGARQFLEDLSVPSQWFEEALAYRCAIAGDTHGYLRHMLQVDTSKVIETLERFLVPNTLFLSGEKLADVLHLLKVFATSENVPLASAVLDFFEIHRRIQMMSEQPREEIEAAIPAFLEVCDEVEQVFVSQQRDDDAKFVSDSFVVPMASFLAEGLSQISLFRLQVLALQSGKSVSSTASQIFMLAANDDLGTRDFSDRENICRWLM
jgi:Nuclear protein 96/Nucleoporin autopeptidase